MKNLNSVPNHFEKLREMIKDIQFAMFTTVDEAGQLRSRPMATQKMEDNGDLWFFTSFHSPKVEDVKITRQVNLVYSTGSHRFVSVSGDAEVIKDVEKAKELWSLGAIAWFPKGVEDPDLALIRVKPTKAEYWDSTSNTFIQLFSLAKSALTGKRYEGENTDHQKLAV